MDPAERKPNVVIIYGDDVGYGDVGVYGAKKIPTPNIDRLASEGLMFTDGHSPAATCTPARFSLLTGVQGFRHNAQILQPNAPLIISDDTLTMPKVFKRAGYTTGVIGKWHLGFGREPNEPDWNSEVSPGPREVGFDYSFLLPYTNDRVPCVYLENQRVADLDPGDPISIGREKAYPQSTEYPDGKLAPESMSYMKSSQGHDESVINGIGRIGYMYGGRSALWNDEEMADVFVRKMEDFISENKQSPFFLYFASQDIHVPRTPHPRFRGLSEHGYRGDAMVQFDWTTGKIMEALDKNGLSDNTIVIFSSDNGPVYDDGYVDGTTVYLSTEPCDGGHYAAGPYRGGKYQIYEGGTRVPFIVRWPEKVAPGVSSALVSQTDLLASFAALLDVDLPADQAEDSRNMLAALTGHDDKGLPFIIEEAFKELSVRRGEWKYIAPVPGKKPARLYNIDEDVGEKNNLADMNPDVRNELDRLLKRLMEAGCRDVQRDYPESA